VSAETALVSALFSARMQSTATKPASIEHLNPLRTTDTKRITADWEP
jgi:hypothetical protein